LHHPSGEVAGPARMGRMPATRDPSTYVLDHAARGAVYAPCTAELLGAPPREIFERNRLSYPMPASLVLETDASIVVPLAGLLAHLRVFEVLRCGPGSHYSRATSAREIERARLLTHPIKIFSTRGMPLQSELLALLHAHRGGVRKISVIRNDGADTRTWSNPCSENHHCVFAGVLSGVPTDPDAWCIVKPNVTTRIVLSGLDIGSSAPRRAPRHHQRTLRSPGRRCRAQPARD
jgi:hypothetical protein